MAETEKKTRPWVRRFLTRRWMVVGIVLIAAGAGLGFFLGKKRDVPDVEFKLNDDLTIKLVDILPGHHNRASAHFGFSLNQFLVNNLPNLIVRRLDEWKLLDCNDAYFRTKAAASIEINDPNEVNFIFAMSLSGPIKFLLTSNYNAGLERLRGTVNAQERAYYLRLYTPDGKFNRRSMALPIDVSVWPVGGKLSIHTSYTNAHFNWIPVNYPEVILALEAGPEGVPWSDPLKQIRIANPAYRQIDPPGPVQQLPATATDGDVTVVLHRVIGDVATNNLGAESLEGESALELLEKGELLRANFAAGDSAHTWLKMDFLENGSPTENWEPAKEIFRYGDETPIGSGYGTGIPGHGYFLATENVGVADGPVIVDLTLRRKGDFPADEITTFTISLPAVGTKNGVFENTAFWNGKFQLKSVSSRKAGSSYSRREILEFSGEGDPDILLRAVHFVNETTTRTTTQIMSSGSRNPNEFLTNYRFDVDFDSRELQVDPADFTTVSLELVSPRTREFRFIVQPEKATITAKPVQ